MFLGMHALFRVYRHLNILSIDVAAGAVCCAAWFALLFGVQVKPYAFISLGLTVWIIYTADHLLDVARVKIPASTERHRFHQRHFTTLIIVLAVAVLTDIIFVVFIRKIIFQWGVVLATAMIFYFLIQRYLIYVKELVVALLFSCGVLLPSFSLIETFPGGKILFVMSSFVLTALINLILFSWFDQTSDTKDNRASFATQVGERKTKSAIVLLFVLNAVLMILTVLLIPESYMHVALMFSMNIILIFLFTRKEYFEVDDRYRIVGDGIFFIPLLYIVLS